MSDELLKAEATKEMSIEEHKANKESVEETTNNKGND